MFRSRLWIDPVAIVGRLIGEVLPVANASAVDDGSGNATGAARTRKRPAVPVIGEADKDAIVHVVKRLRLQASCLRERSAPHVRGRALERASVELEDVVRVLIRDVERTLAVHRKSGDRSSLARVLQNLASLAYRQGDRT